MVKPTTKFKSFEDKIVDYHQKRLEFFYKGTKKTSQKAKTLYKAKKDIMNRINNSLDAIMAFSQIIDSGMINKQARKKYAFSSHTLYDKLTEFEIAGKKNPVKIQFVKEQREFMQKLFNTSRMDQILNEIFRFNGVAIRPRHLEKKGKTKWEYEEGDSLSQNDLIYYRTISRMLAETGISQIKKFLDKKSPHDKPIINQLDLAVSLINEISYNPERKISHS